MLGIMLCVCSKSAAFDTVDHAILLAHLEHCVGIKGSALKWFKSYFSNQSFRVNIGEYSSGVASLSCGVPQGSILAPILFSLYMLFLGSMVCLSIAMQMTLKSICP